MQLAKSIDITKSSKINFLEFLQAFYVVNKSKYSYVDEVSGAVTDDTISSDITVTLLPPSLLSPRHRPLRRSGATYAL